MYNIYLNTCEHIKRKFLINYSSFLTNSHCRKKHNIVGVNEKAVDLAYDIYENEGALKSKSKPLIISHGLFGNKGNWKTVCSHLLKSLSPARKIIVVDNRNHGESPHVDVHTYSALSADFAYLLQTLSLSEAHFLGHSMGGRAVMYTALTQPNLVTSAIIVDISPIAAEINIDVPDYVAALKNINLNQSANDLHGFKKYSRGVLSQYISDDGIVNFLLQNLVREKDGRFRWRINLDCLISNYGNISSFPLLQQNYSKPTLFIKGEKSDYLQETDFEQIKSIFPQAKFSVIPNAGHWVHTESTGNFVQVVSEFLNSHNDA